MIASLRKVHKMASDRRQLYYSATDKLREFIALQYPTKLLHSACNLLAYSTAVGTWTDVRNHINHIDDTCLQGGMNTTMTPAEGLNNRTVQRPVSN